MWYVRIKIRYPVGRPSGSVFGVLLSGPGCPGIFVRDKTAFSALMFFKILELVESVSGMIGTRDVDSGPGSRTSFSGGLSRSQSDRSQQV